MKSRYRRLRTCVVALVALPLPASAQIEAGLDQYHLAATVTGLIHSANPSGQWFTVGKDGLLWAVEFPLATSHPGVSEDLLVEVVDFTGGIAGPVLDALFVSPGSAWSLPDTLDAASVTGFLIEFHSLGILVTAGDQLGIRLSTLETSPKGYSFRFTGSGAYPAGDMITGTGVNVGSDLAFKTFVAVPLFADGLETGDTTGWSSTMPP